MREYPTRLGPYEIVSLIGDSHDLVLEGIDSRNGLRVAVKTVAPGPAFSERCGFLRREARIALSLSHPALVSTLETGEADGAPYFAMEFLEGNTLEQELARGGALPADRSVSIALDVLAGLDWMHRRGIVHRDVKPANITLVKDGSLRLSDFGMALLPLESDGGKRKSTAGTPEYMSPEQTVAAEIDARSDLFSLGAVLYEMLGAKPAFTGDTLHAVAYAVSYKNPLRPEGVSDALWEVLRRSLSKKPEGRFPSASAMAEALSGCQTR